MDDNADNADMFAAFLRSCGGNAVAVRSATEALTYLEAEPTVDIIITDLVMPGVGGVQFVQRVRQQSKYQDVPAICISGFNAKDFEHDAKEFVAILLEPVDDLDDLALRIKAAVVAAARHITN